MRLISAVKVNGATAWKQTLPAVAQIAFAP